MLEEDGPLSADELKRIRDARYGLKELVDDAGFAWALYSDWYGSHWNDVGRPNDGSGFPTLLQDWRQKKGDNRTMAEMYADPESWTRAPGRQGPRPLIKVVTDKAIDAKVQMNAKAFHFPNEVEKANWMSDEKAQIERQMNLAFERKQDSEILPTECIGTLFFYWVLEATNRFYERFLKTRDRNFLTQRQRITEKDDCYIVADLSNFSNASRFAFTLTKGFEPAHAPDQCKYIVDLWHSSEKKNSRRDNMRNRLFLANALFNPPTQEQAYRPH
ncbi:MAG: hypothetical protein ABJ327_01870 [Litoreibacter sp.]